MTRHVGGRPFFDSTPSPEPEPDPDPLPPIPGSREAGGDPHDVMGHAVDFEGQDCIRCRDEQRREMEDWGW
jgi:hypothetical protein